MKRKVYRKNLKLSDPLLKEARIATEDQKLPELLKELPRQLRSDARVEELLVRAIVLAFILPLQGKALQSRPGMALVYQKLFGNAWSAAAAMVRRIRPGVLAETRKLLRVGPEAYTNTALREISELFKAS